MITIVDYQMETFEALEGNRMSCVFIRISCDPKETADAEKLVLPGVGAFGDAMAEINRRGLGDPIRDFIKSDRLFLGICLGLQLLFERGFENGEGEGFRKVAWEVIKFDLPDSYKVPRLLNTTKATKECEILRDTPDGTHLLFVHSYYVCPSDPDLVALECEYGERFAMVQRQNLFATQFHPEKSHKTD